MSLEAANGGPGEVPRTPELDATLVLDTLAGRYAELAAPLAVPAGAVAGAIEGAKVRELSTKIGGRD